MTGNKTVLVLGATGGIGGEVAQRLMARDWKVTALTRHLSTLSEAKKRSGYHWLQGDSMNREDVIRSAQGAEVIVHAVNPAGYKNWDRLSIPMLENTIEAAKTCHARILFPGTLYNFDAESPQPIRESTEQRASTKKGRIRIQMEALLKNASEEGARVLIVRAGDYFGPHPGNNWFSQGLIKPGKPIRAITYPGKAGVGHAWAYLPDVAETMTKLLEHESSLGAFEVFHFAGHWDPDGTQMIDAIKKASRQKGVHVRRLPWFAIRALAPFVTLFKEMLEIRYLWDRPFRLDNRRLTEILGSEPHTSLDEAVTKTLNGLGCQNKT